jgi:adiponectin receptor
MALGWGDLANWQRDNEYIFSGYRKPSYSIYHSIRDIKNLHNESVNIWSHLLATILFSIYLVRFFSQWNSLSTDNLMVLLSFLGIIICFALSTIYHIFSNHSRRVANWTQRLDHLGVIVVIWTSAISFTYFGFSYGQLRRFYMSIVSITALISTNYVFRSKFRQSKNRLIRIFTYLSLGCSAFLPAIHLLIRNKELSLSQRTVLTSYKQLAVLNLLGGLFYGTRIPERFYKKTFDIYGASHQIMHVLVICGALVYQTSLLTILNYGRGEMRQG